MRKLKYCPTNVRPSASVCKLTFANVHTLVRKFTCFLTNVACARRMSFLTQYGCHFWTSFEPDTRFLLARCFHKEASVVIVVAQRRRRRRCRGRRRRCRGQDWLTAFSGVRLKCSTVDLLCVHSVFETKARVCFVWNQRKAHSRRVRQ